VDTVATAISFSNNLPMPSDPTTPHVRRKRYRGTHPREFKDKYKELDSQNFADDVQKVIARGQTPAGTHRPICVDEILAILNPQSGDGALDCTLGFGGHTQSIISRLLPGGKLFAVDVDSVERLRTEARLRAAGFGEDVLTIRELNFADIETLLPESGKFDCILADLGVSSMQLDDPTRGFSYKNDGPLDLRLNPLAGEPASALLQSMRAYDLGQLISNYADEPYAARIAYGIKRSATPILTTQQLTENIRATLKDFPDKDDHKKTLARTFMALRIEVNQEFGVLDRFIAALPKCMKPGGRAAILTFHSGEDRRIEAAFKQFASDGIFSSISTEPIRPSPEEQRSNPRSTSAKLRWGIRSNLA
jgi:16S rRNA (cytosine1402-N4)-methyltransferase